MLTLTRRQEDRARRRGENSELNASDAAPTGQDAVGDALNALNTAEALIEALTDEERAELSRRKSNDGEPSPDFRPTDPQTVYAGVGVVNTAIPPVTGAENLSPEAIAALDAQGRADAQQQNGNGSGASSWGGPQTADDETIDSDGKPLTAAKLKAILDARSVKYETDANVPALQALVKANPAKSA